LTCYSVLDRIFDCSNFILMRKISVIIPLYNGEKYIADTIESVLNQTWRNKEIIVVESGSTDNSLEVAKSYEGNDLKIFSIKKLNASGSRNFGMLKANGDFIQFLDADDILSPDKIERQMTLLESKPKGFIAACAWGKFRKDISEARCIEQKVWKESRPIEWLVKAWDGEGMMANSCWLVPSDIIKQSGIWDERLTLHDDGEFFCRVILNAKGIAFCESAKVYYRVAENSLSKTYDRKAAESALNVYRSYKTHILMYEDSQRVRRALLNNFLQFIYQFHPQYLDLIEIAYNEARDLGFKSFPPPRGRSF